MAATAYFALMALAGALTFAHIWPAAIIAALLALLVAFRYEVRWLADHTPLTKFSPRPVPQHRRR